MAVLTFVPVDRPVNISSATLGPMPWTLTLRCAANHGPELGTHEGSVKKARENVAVDSRLIDAVQEQTGRSLYSGLRLRIQLGDITISCKRTLTLSYRGPAEISAYTLWASSIFFERLGLDPTVGYPVIVDQNLFPSSSLEEASSGGAVELLETDGGAHHVLVISAHGGGIENNTEDQADRAAARFRLNGYDVDLYKAISFRTNEEQNAGFASSQLHHVTMENQDPKDAAAYPQLNTLWGNSYQVVLAFHGAPLASTDAIALGGLMSNTNRDILGGIVETAIRNVPGWETTTVDTNPDDHIDGDHPSNPQNLFTDGSNNSLQLETTSALRTDVTARQTVTDTVVDWLISNIL